MKQSQIFTFGTVMPMALSISFGTMAETTSRAKHELRLLQRAGTIPLDAAAAAQGTGTACPLMAWKSGDLLIGRFATLCRMRLDDDAS